MALVNGVTRGQTPTRENVTEVIQAVMRIMKTQKEMR
jgi:methyl coenzyme M reductase subunit C